MARFAFIVAAAAAATCAAFATPSRTLALSSQRPKTVLFGDDDTQPETMTGKGRLGSSIDQDGKSNIWAVEPKMSVDSDAGASGGSLAAIGVGAVLSVALIAGAFLFINVEQ